MVRQHLRGRKAKSLEFAGTSPPALLLPPPPPQTHTFHVQGNTGGAEWTKITTSTGFFIFKKNQFCVGKFKPLDFPGKGKKQMLEVRRRAKGRPAKDKNIQNIENTQDIHKVYSTFETFQIFDVLNIDIWRAE